MAKATKAQLRKRVEEVLSIRLDGAELHDIRQYAAEKEWGVSDRTLRKYIAAADKSVLVVVEKDRARNVARHIAQRRRLYAKAVQAEELRTALSVLTDEAELLGLYDKADSLEALLERLPAELAAVLRGWVAQCLPTLGSDGGGTPPAA